MDKSDKKHTTDIDLPVATGVIISASAVSVLSLFQQLTCLWSKLVDSGDCSMTTPRIHYQQSLLRLV